MYQIPDRSVKKYISDKSIRAKRPIRGIYLHSSFFFWLNCAKSKQISRKRERANKEPETTSWISIRGWAYTESSIFRFLFKFSIFQLYHLIKKRWQKHVVSILVSHSKKLFFNHRNMFKKFSIKSLLDYVDDTRLKTQGVIWSFLLYNNQR